MVQKKAVGLQEIWQQRGWCQKQQKIAAIRPPVLTKQARSDRGFWANSGGRTAGLKATVAVGTQVFC